MDQRGVILLRRQRHSRALRAAPKPGVWALKILLSFLLFIAIISGATLAVAAGTAAGVYAYFARQLPDASAIETEQEQFETVRIYDRTGKHLLYESIDPRPFRGDRTYVPLDQISPYLIHATIALEDRSFYENPGVNFRGVARAFVSNLRGGSVQGGSSITQQLVKNVLIPPEERYKRSYARKIKEMILALEITRRYPGRAGKDQILEWYLNYNFYGNAAYGVEAASRIYFDKAAKDLTLDEAAMLAALPQYPGLNPIQAPADAYRRQRKVLDAMVEAGYLTRAEADRAKRYFNDRLLDKLVEKGLLPAADVDPVRHGDSAATARALHGLVNMGLISADEAERAIREGGVRWQFVRQRAGERFEIPPDAPHFALYVLHQLDQEFNTADDPYFIWRNGLQVYTTLDWDLQQRVQCIARAHIAYLQNRTPEPYPGCDPPPRIEELNRPKLQFDHDVTNAAVVVIRPKTGEILAMMGSLDYYNKDIDGEVNNALSERQPGSSFKPFTYLTAFQQGFTPATMVMDVRTVFPDPPNPPYIPENYDRKYHGPQSLREALARSYNIPAVWLMSQVGVKNVIKMAHRMGINTLTKDYYGLSLTLGGGEVRLLDMTYAFSVLANNGVMAGEPVPAIKQRPGYRTLDPVSVLLVRDKNGRILKEYREPHVKRIISPQLAYLMNDVLSDTKARLAAFGSFSKYLALEDRPVAAKTGTTNDYRDAWTIGYTPQLAVGVWVGNADNHPMKHVPGSLGAAPIFHQIMEDALKGKPVEKWQEPPGMVRVTVCVPSGLLPTDDCPTRREELFIAGTEPHAYDTVYRAYEVNKVTGKLATQYTPRDLVERRVYMIFPPEAADWVREAGIPQPPKQYDDAYGPGPVDPEVAIIDPKPYSYVRGIIPIIGNAQMGGFRSYRVEFGEGLNPGAWMQIGPEHHNQVGNGVLEYWDTTPFNGLYTLRLTVTKGDGSTRTTTTQITVDNTPPKVKIVHPYDGKAYVMEDDEWVSITAKATDDWSMDRVEFLLDGRPIGTSTVPPYSIRWTIAMSDTIPEEGRIISETRPITMPDGSVQLGEVPVMTTTVETLADGTKRLIETWESGRTVISDTHGYTETHVIQLKAYDSAGNMAEADPIRILVTHKQEEEGAIAWGAPVEPEGAWVPRPSGPTRSGG
ncbi:MAG: transglycosylase domain-containing protein [Anaerolineae bacterium]|nr:transglycosylase domain-containing protein [Anaerolineae bacterium]